jgi:hypothetical protein
LKLVGLNDRVQRVLRIIGLEGFFSPYHTRTAALADRTAGSGCTRSDIHCIRDRDYPDSAHRRPSTGWQ